MELDDLKGAWAQYDTKLSKNLKLNEELLKKMNMNNSKHELQKPLKIEIGNIVWGFLLVVYVTSSSVRFIEELRFSIPGFLSAIIGLVYLIFSTIKVNRFLRVDYFGSSIVKLQKDIAELSTLILRLRKFEFILMPILLISIFPVVFKSVLNVDIYENIKLFALEVIFCIVISILVSIWGSRHFVDKKINNAKKELEELVKFENEE
jgi:hypothetical protein